MKRVIFIILLLSLAYPTSAGLRQESAINIDNIQKLVEEQVNLGPRIPGSTGSLAFLDWVATKVIDPWKVTIQEFEYKGVKLNNIIISTNETLTPVLLAAHWDTRAIANNDPNVFKRDEPVPGANDGASGVAALLEIMTLIPDAVADKFAILLFDGEDQGSEGMEGWDWIVGSKYFAESMTEVEVNNTDAFILLDMIGDDELNLPYERKSTSSLVDEFWGLAADMGYGSIFLDEPGYSLIDDHIPFLSRGIPSLDIIDFDYPEWHTVSDDVENISAESIAIVADVLLSWMIVNYFGDTPISYEPLTSVTTSSTPFNFSIIAILILARYQCCSKAPMQ